MIHVFKPADGDRPARLVLGFTFAELDELRLLKAVSPNPRIEGLKFVAFARAAVEELEAELDAEMERQRRRQRSSPTWATNFGYNPASYYSDSQERLNEWISRLHT